MIYFFLKEGFLKSCFFYSLFSLSKWKNFGVLVLGFHLHKFVCTGNLKNCFLSKRCFQNDYCLLFFFLVTLFDLFFSQSNGSKVKLSPGSIAVALTPRAGEKHQEGVNGDSDQSLLGRTVLHIPWRKVGDGNSFGKVTLSV